MTAKSANTQTVPMLTPKDEQIFIDRLVEILIMQVEANENEHGYKLQEKRIRNII